MAKIIRSWEELVGLESDTHYLEIDLRYGNGHIKNKDKTAEYEHNYLSTHTFYGLNYVDSTCILQSCGFDIIIDNWDNPLDENMDKEKFVKVNMMKYNKTKEKHKAEIEEDTKKCKEEKVYPNTPYISSIFPEMDKYMALDLIKSSLKKQNSSARYDEYTAMRHTQPRNELCNCESGKKFKNCCGK